MARKRRKQKNPPMRVFAGDSIAGLARHVEQESNEALLVAGVGFEPTTFGL
ncbi:hypothetical protein P3T21_004064 [Paraburkholderia sp. GAS334]|jgi:hypothetical protein